MGFHFQTGTTQPAISARCNRSREIPYPFSFCALKTHTRHFSCRLKNAYRGLQVENPGQRHYSANLAR